METNQKIKLYRLLNGMDQATFASSLNVESRELIAQWERGFSLPQKKDLSKLKLGSWILGTAKLYPHLFIPLSPHGKRTQAKNMWLKSMRELLPLFVINEGLKDEVTTYELTNGFIFMLGQHIILALDPFGSAITETFAATEIKTTYKRAVQIDLYHLLANKEVCNESLTEITGLINLPSSHLADKLIWLRACKFAITIDIEPASTLPSDQLFDKYDSLEEKIKEELDLLIGKLKADDPEGKYSYSLQSKTEGS